MTCFHLSFLFDKQPVDYNTGEIDTSWLQHFSSSPIVVHWYTGMCNMSGEPGMVTCCEILYKGADCLYLGILTYPQIVQVVHSRWEGSYC